MSSCFAVDELPTSECHPEIAPHAMATNRMGQSGPTASDGKNVLKAGWVSVTFVTGESSAPMMMRITAPKAGKNATKLTGWMNVGSGRIAPAYRNTRQTTAQKGSVQTPRK